MKKLVINLVIPLTLISFVFVTRLWKVQLDDCTEIFLFGFPFPFLGDGWHTSMSLQVFMLEFIFDLLFYFLMWFLVVFVVDRFLKKLKPNPFLIVGLWLASGIILFFTVLTIRNPDHIYDTKRNFDMEIIDSSVFFFGQDTKGFFFE